MFFRQTRIKRLHRIHSLLMSSASDFSSLRLTPSRPIGWADGPWLGGSQGADGEAGQGGAGEMGVQRHGLPGGPPPDRHPPSPPALITVHRRHRSCRQRERPYLKTCSHHFGSVLECVLAKSPLSLSRSSSLKCLYHRHRSPSSEHPKGLSKGLFLAQYFLGQI